MDWCPEARRLYNLTSRERVRSEKDTVQVARARNSDVVMIFWIAVKFRKEGAVGHRLEIARTERARRANLLKVEQMRHG